MIRRDEQTNDRMAFSFMHTKTTPLTNLRRNSRDLGDGTLVIADRVFDLHDSRHLHLVLVA